MLVSFARTKFWVTLVSIDLLCFNFVVAQQAATDNSASQPQQSPNLQNTTPSPNPAGQPTPPADSSSSATASTLDYLFNHKGQKGSIAKEGMDANQQAKTDTLADDALGNKQIEDPNIRLQFDTYLAMTEVPQTQLNQYSDETRNVIDLLHQKRTTQAWQKLYKLAEFQLVDSGVSWELANRIEAIWNAGETKEELAQQNTKLQERSDTDNRNADIDSDDIKDKELDYMKRLKEANGRNSKYSQNQIQSPAASNNTSQTGSNEENPATMVAPPSDQLLGKLQLTQEYLDSLSAQAKIKLNELKVEKLLDQAKQDFADYISTLYNTGRYEHVIIASDFWRQIFDEGDYPVAMAQQVNASLEIIGRTQTIIGVFSNNLKQNYVSAASDNLQQAYLLYPSSPAVLGIPLGQKKPILSFSRQLNRMRNMIEGRDFTDLESILGEIKITAPDFDSTKAMSIVNGVKLESQLNLGKAKLAAQQGDLKSAMEDFQAAAETWPGNPDLKNKALSFFDAEDVKNQSIVEFDRLVAENNYETIYDKQLMLEPALKDDAKRQDQLKVALAKVKIREAALEKATMMESSGDIYGAWETVQLANKDLPGDVKLNSLRGDLAAKGADFVSAISKAQEAENRKELGFSLTWYAVAQRDYPASQFANQGIERLSRLILASQDQH